MISGAERTEVELAGFQLSDESVWMRIWIYGETESLDASEALMLATTLSRAAEELQRIEDDSL
jgi:hypothetical protein